MSDDLELERSRVENWRRVAANNRAEADASSIALAHLRDAYAAAGCGWQGSREWHGHTDCHNRGLQAMYEALPDADSAFAGFSANRLGGAA